MRSVAHRILAASACCVVAILLSIARPVEAHHEKNHPDFRGTPAIVTASVVKVIDGDTFEIVATIWLNLLISERVRVRGIDTPERSSSCVEEREMALKSTKALEDLVLGKQVSLTQIGRDKYGRILATVWRDGYDVGNKMVDLKMARPYDGGARKPWCVE